MPESKIPSHKTDKDLKEKADGDPFYSEENQKVLLESVNQLRNGKCTSHELIKA